MDKRRYRILLSVFVLLYLAGTALLCFMLWKAEGDLQTQAMERLADEISVGAVYGGASYLSDVASEYGILWIHGDGHVLYDSGTSPEGGVRTVTRTLPDDSVLRITASRGVLSFPTGVMIVPVILLLLLQMLLTVIFIVILSGTISRLVAQIDVESPDMRKDYGELTPLVRRIKRQNDLIARQMHDLRSRQEEFLTITQNMSEGLILINNKTEVLSCNSSAKALFGKGDIAYGKTVLEVDPSGAFSDAVYAALRGEHRTPILAVGSRVYQLFASPVTVEGSVSGAVLLLLDVTEKEQRDAMRREFTSNVSHELKTPLTSIYGISDMMMNGIVRPEDVGSFAKNIHDESGRLITLIDDILRLSRLDEGVPEESRQQVDLYAIAAEVVERLALVAAERSITVTLTGEASPMEGIPSILSEMVYNLCDNAIKYNRDGGSVQVDVSNEEGHIVLAVRDNGIGIAQKHQNRVFERFYRADKSHSKAIGGTGLGLSIVKHGAAYHGAQVLLSSKEGVGTTVTVTF